MEWRRVIQDNRYEVSEFGDVRSTFMKVVEKNTGKTYYKKPRILSQFKNKKGYLLVQLGQRSIPVHRIVAMAFLENKENLPQVDHKDCDKTNNHYTNLDWVTTEENLKRAYESGLRTVDGLNKYNQTRSRKVMKVETGEVFESIQATARAMNIKNSASNIKRACDLGTRSYGFHWCYV
jgi:uncharacterized protein (UPF0248 family)